MCTNSLSCSKRLMGLTARRHTPVSHIAFDPSVGRHSARRQRVKPEAETEARVSERCRHLVCGDGPCRHASVRPDCSPTAVITLLLLITLNLTISDDVPLIVYLIIAYSTQCQQQTVMCILDLTGTCMTSACLSTVHWQTIFPEFLLMEIMTKKTQTTRGSFWDNRQSY